MFFIRWILGFFFGPPAPVAQVLGYGFAWVPNTAFNNLNFITITNQSPANLYVMVAPQVVTNPGTFFEDVAGQLGIIFPLPAALTPGFVNAMQGVQDGNGAPVTADNNQMQHLQGFLQYTHYCLNYINATPAGQNLLNALRTAARPTYIGPSPVHNQTAGMSRCFVARMVIDNNMNIGVNERAQLIQILEQTAGVQGINAFNWLANQINQMPLYSMYEQSNAYPPTFLTTGGAPVNGADLQAWFNTGSNCNLVNNLTNAAPIQGVPLLNFVRNAVIVSLYTNSPAGPGSGNNIDFDVRDWSQNNFGEDQTQNTMADRPPAIGLAHELIHAYHNVRGDQPGVEFGGYSTTLFELLCVGMGPWAAYPVTENAIRNAWPPVGVWPAAGDPLNNRVVAQRTIYVPPGPGLQPAQMRAGNGPI